MWLPRRQFKSASLFADKSNDLLINDASNSLTDKMLILIIPPLTSRRRFFRSRIFPESGRAIVERVIDSEMQGIRCRQMNNCGAHDL